MMKLRPSFALRAPALTLAAAPSGFKGALQ